MGVENGHARPAKKGVGRAGNVDGAGVKPWPAQRKNEGGSATAKDYANAFACNKRGMAAY